MEQMGSPYLMAHGLGTPVKDAQTTIDVTEPGDYAVYVRTYNWTSPWYKGLGPGRFSVLINDEELSNDKNKANLVPDKKNKNKSDAKIDETDKKDTSTLGGTGKNWEWQYAGSAKLEKPGSITLTLHDKTGFNGRCDAVYLTTDKNTPPPSEAKALEAFRRKQLNLPDTPAQSDNFDFVVIGGGIAGMSAAVTAARLGLKTALVQDRPVLGGNNSSEVRVHLGGRIETKPYPRLGELQKEFGPTRGGNAQPASFYEDDKKTQIVLAEPNITLLANYRALNPQTKNGTITAVTLRHIENGTERLVTAPLFADCTGDGSIGAAAGADFATGREARKAFDEQTAPEKADAMTMGSSVQWYSEKTDTPVSFPSFQYGLSFSPETAERVTMGEWTWETGMNKDQIKDFELIRDYGLLVVFSNWSFLKNELNKDGNDDDKNDNKNNNDYTNRKLGWVAYIAGKRESRRLLGDHILTENDIRNHVPYPDATGSTTWSIDLHYPDPKQTAYFPGTEFKSIAKHIRIDPYPVPYRCLYSRNLDNLFLGGRNISVTHVALGTTRVMRTTGILGEVVGMAAALCHKYKVKPRDIYAKHLDELKSLMEKGVGDPSLPNNQRYNAP